MFWFVLGVIVGIICTKYFNILTRLWSKYTKKANKKIEEVLKDED
jgi:hypothetical protein